MSKIMQAAERYKTGVNCAQAIFATYSEQFGLDQELALKIACGLGAGMGRLGGTCGAVSAAYLVIGLKHGQVSLEDKEAKEKTYELVQQFSKRFIEKNEFTNCKELLGIDFLTSDKNVATAQAKLLCPQMIKSAAEILEDILNI